VQNLDNLESYIDPLQQKTTGRPQGQWFPQTPTEAFRQSEFELFRASSSACSRSACPRSSLPKLPSRVSLAFE